MDASFSDVVIGGFPIRRRRPKRMPCARVLNPRLPKKCANDPIPTTAPVSDSAPLTPHRPLAPSSDPVPGPEQPEQSQASPSPTTASASTDEPIVTVAVTHLAASRAAEIPLANAPESPPQSNTNPLSCTPVGPPGQPLAPVDALAQSSPLAVAVEPSQQAPLFVGPDAQPTSPSVTTSRSQASACGVAAKPQSSPIRAPTPHEPRPPSSPSTQSVLMASAQKTSTPPSSISKKKTKRTRRAEIVRRRVEKMRTVTPKGYTTAPIEMPEEARYAILVEGYLRSVEALPEEASALQEAVEAGIAAARALEVQSRETGSIAGMEKPCPGDRGVRERRHKLLYVLEQYQNEAKEWAEVEADLPALTSVPEGEVAMLSHVPEGTGDVYGTDISVGDDPEVVDSIEAFLIHVHDMNHGLKVLEGENARAASLIAAAQRAINIKVFGDGSLDLNVAQIAPSPVAFGSRTRL